MQTPVQEAELIDLESDKEYDLVSAGMVCCCATSCKLL